ncbi:E3 ubiquitin-protein ligase TRIM39-like [Cottoperca gobio]|uniref:E3 ubiquitin-protein ligase TRIM39-like n=1 Tax=Cottoperca gobio TaxID=56716 RepID=A0A6J2RMN2_COTGO|nr:E3 ubiquitin-protein ligase TRIM39-like [Cottoperca gobio]
MASGNSLLSEEQLRCPICLDVFTRPVSTPCGHNFCISCITSYWKDIPVITCPICKETFATKPDLKVNTFISGLALQFKSLQVTDAHMLSSDQHQARSSGAVLCDICTEQKAVKFCLECLTYYCNVHLEPHHRVAGLKRHTLIESLASLADRICRKHTRLLTFCRNDSVLLCDVCTGSHHVNHDVVPVQQACEEIKAQVENAEVEVQQMIQGRLQKVQIMKGSVRQSKIETKDVIANSVQDLMALISAIQESKTEFAKVMEEQQKAAEEQADGFIRGMEQEITELRKTMMKLRELKQTEDQLCFLRSFPSSVLLPHTMDLSTVSFNSQVEIHEMQKSVSKSVSQLRVMLNKMNTEIRNFSDGTDTSTDATLRYMQQYEVEVLLDPDMAHPQLILSADRKQVRYSITSDVNWNPNMFAVLGQRGFSSCKFYFEVFVGGKTEWNLGVTNKSSQRMEMFGCGIWAIWFKKDKFEAYSSPNVPVHFGIVERVGVFVDYDGGQISFYDVQTAKPIHSFTECVFTEELLPFLNPCDDEYGSNLGPMIIVPVSRTE